MPAALRIGPYRFANNLALAPMAGVTDQPFRRLCRRLGAGLAASEMLSADPSLWDTRKSRLRRDHRGEPDPRIVQIAGGDPQSLAAAARRNVAHGAQIIDINMGCPAKKVCRKWAGSALLADEELVAEILHATVAAVDVPVTLKIRTGPDPERRNAVRIARIAQAAGISALAIHGRTRADAYRGAAEYETIRAVRRVVDMPLLANGDIDSPQRAREVLQLTGVDGLMIGRAAQGRPWIFREIAAFLDHGDKLPAPSQREIAEIALSHIAELHAFYGPAGGVRIARKHIGWYLNNFSHAQALRQALLRELEPAAQLDLFQELMVAPTAACAA